MAKKVELFGLAFCAHLILIILVYSSPFLFSWIWVGIGILILFIEYWIFKGCVLTHTQFGKDDSMTFYTIYLEMLGFKFNRKRFKFFIRNIMPFIVLIIAIFWQIILKKSPLLF